jgi:hypothetical protein
MKDKIFIILAVFVFFMPSHALAQGGNAPVLVELFTAENCPACPPADEYLAKLAKSNSVVALACHVDYFGRGTAALGKSFCTKRQDKYIKQIGRKKYYTPQMMINGQTNEIGYKSSKVAAKISKARRDQTKRIAIHNRGQGVFDFMLPSHRLDKSVDLWVATYNKPVVVSNRGRQNTFTNVVQNFIPMGSWNGLPDERAVFPLINSSSAGFIVAAQDSSTGKVVAVGEYKL